MNKKEYHKFKSHEWYLKHKELVLIRSAQWKKEHPEKVREIQRRSQLKTNYKAYKDYIERYPERYKARKMVNHRLERNTLKKELCGICGNPKSQAHHYLGYSRENWLNVQWLCHKHHLEQHHGKQI